MFTNSLSSLSEVDLEQLAQDGMSSTRLEADEAKLLDVLAESASAQHTHLLALLDDLAAQLFQNGQGRCPRHHRGGLVLEASNCDEVAGEGDQPPAGQQGKDEAGTQMRDPPGAGPVGSIAPRRRTASVPPSRCDGSHPLTGEPL